MAAVDICRDDPLLLSPALLFEWSQLRQQIENRLEPAADRREKCVNDCFQEKGVTAADLVRTKTQKRFRQLTL